MNMENNEVESVRPVFDLLILHGPSIAPLIPTAFRHSSDCPEIRATIPPGPNEFGPVIECHLIETFFHGCCSACFEIR